MGALKASGLRRLVGQGEMGFRGGPGEHLESQPGLPRAHWAPLPPSGRTLPAQGTQVCARLRAGVPEPMERVWGHLGMRISLAWSLQFQSRKIHLDLHYRWGN